MPNYLNLQLGGHLGQDPNLRYTRNGKPVVEFSIAHNTGKGRDDPYNKTVWFDCVAWNDLAEEIAKNYSKSKAIEIAKATVNLDEWEDRRTGQQRSKLKWVIWELKAEGQQQLSGQGSNSNAQQEDTGAPFPDEDIPY